MIRATSRFSLCGALLIALLMALAVACGNNAADAPDDQTPAEPTVEPTPEIGNRVGNLAPEFTVVTTNGVTRSLTDYKQANQPVVVYFFASW